MPRAPGSSRLAMGSDWGVSTPNPLEEIEVAVTRVAPEFRDHATPFLPQEALSLADAIEAFTLGSVGRVRPTRIENPNGVNLTAYCVGAAGEDYVTIINKAHGANPPDAAVTIVAPGLGIQGAQVMTLAGAQRGDAQGTKVTLGGATITGDAPWNGTWSTVTVGPDSKISLTVQATTAAIVKISSAG